jgi:hypothetical protein
MDENREGVVHSLRLFNVQKTEKQRGHFKVSLKALKICRADAQMKGP